MKSNILILCSVMLISVVPGCNKMGNLKSRSLAFSVFEKINDSLFSSNCWFVTNDFILIATPDFKHYQWTRLGVTTETPTNTRTFFGNPDHFESYRNRFKYKLQAVDPLTNEWVKTELVLNEGYDTTQCEVLGEFEFEGSEIASVRSKTAIFKNFHTISNEFDSTGAVYSKKVWMGSTAHSSLIDLFSNKTPLYDISVYISKVKENYYLSLTYYSSKINDFKSIYVKLDKI